MSRMTFWERMGMHMLGETSEQTKEIMMSMETDQQDYNRAMIDGDHGRALAIECRYGLDGYPPMIVSVWFAAELRESGSGNAAVDAALGND